LYERYRVPLGLIKASEGGTPVEAWMSEEALQPFPRKLKEKEKCKEREYLEKIIRQNEENEKDWYRELYKKDRGLARNKLPWYAPEYDCSDWDTMEIPVYFEDLGLKDFNGVIWLRREIELPAPMASREARLIMGRIIDSDTAYINGIRVGETTYQYPPRKYDIPKGVLREGKNQLVIRVVCNNGQGGIAVDKPYKITAGEQSLDLKGEWKYRVGAVYRPLPETIFVQRKPGGLFNGMIAPLLNYRIRGVIWYQGESNDSDPLEYEEMFIGMINDWREKWGQKAIPFLYVQLPNHGIPAAFSPDSAWAVIREAQRKALSVPETAMAVTIDLGEWNDLHPLNKKDVGIRLALAARNLVYGDKDLVYSGPLYRSIKVEGDKAALSFDNTGAGLISRGSKKPAGFFIAGTDKEFLEAEAEIRDKRVIVWNDRVQKPLAVAYAWADNPAAASLYNKEGLPASPFRTDNYRNPIDKSE
ncbi:MAG TPA: sialate O-acetylesterase, partial [Halanaerobiales bacterium]|nr:sialate O-acetylesterase [Halanaerobiales bacterium]